MVVTGRSLIAYKPLTRLRRLPSGHPWLSGPGLLVAHRSPALDYWSTGPWLAHASSLTCLEYWAMGLPRVSIGFIQLTHRPPKSGLRVTDVSNGYTALGNASHTYMYLLPGVTQGSPMGGPWIAHGHPWAYRACLWVTHDVRMRSRWSPMDPPCAQRSPMWFAHLLICWHALPTGSLLRSIGRRQRATRRSSNGSPMDHP